MHSIYNVSHNAQTKPGTLSQTDNENEIGLEKITDIRTDQADIWVNVPSSKMIYIGMVFQY